MPAALLLAAALSASAASPSSLDKKLGQLLMVTAAPDEIAGHEQEIRQGLIGGVLLRAGKMQSEEVRALTARLQGWAADSGTPLLIAVDNEGGPEFTIKTAGLTQFPSNMARGATYSDMYAFLASYFDAKELRALGVSMNLAPVLDVNTNSANPIIGLRSFGGDAETVAEMGQIAVEGSRRARVAPVAKHFPGHGATSSDSHVSLPVVAKSTAELEALELVPFKAAIAAGVPAIMTAHVSYPALDPSGLPATLSRPIVTDLLRRRLGFDGVVVTDDLEMKAISDHWSVPVAAVRAVAAGDDLLLIRTSTPSLVLQALENALHDKVLRAQEVDAAVARVARLKAELGLSGENAALSDDDKKRIERLADQIADRSVTVLEDRGLLPLPAAKKALVVFFAPPGYAGDLEVLAGALRGRLPGVEIALLDAEPDARAAAYFERRAKKSDLLIIGTFHWGRLKYERQVKTVRRLLAAGPPSVVVSLMNPFDQRYFKKARSRLATYGVTPASMRALARVLFGESSAHGLLPVEISTPSGEKPAP